MRKLLLTRDGVLLGDDARDISLEIEVEENWNLTEIIDKILGINYLPKITGGKSTWIIAYDSPIGVIAQQWSKPRFIETKAQPFPYIKNSEGKNPYNLHFFYHAQEDPELVFDVISRFRTVS